MIFKWENEKIEGNLNVYCGGPTRCKNEYILRLVNDPLLYLSWMPLKQVYCGGSLARRCSMLQNTRAVAAGLLRRVFGPPLYMRSSAKISYGKTLHLWCLFIWSFSSFNFLWSIWIKIQIEIGLNRIGPQSWVFIIFVSLFGHWESVR